MKRILLIAFVFFDTISFAQCVIGVNPSSCSGGNALIQILSSPGYDQYQWYYKPVASSGNFQMITGAVSPSLTCDWVTYDQTLIKLECYFGSTPIYFSDTIQLDHVNCSLGVGGVKENLSGLRLSPNPVHDCLMLTSFDKIDQIQIFNSLGQNVFTSTDSNLTKIDVSLMASGMYILKATSGNNSKSIRFIKS